MQSKIRDECAQLYVLTPTRRSARSPTDIIGSVYALFPACEPEQFANKGKHPETLSLSVVMKKRNRSPLMIICIQPMLYPHIPSEV